MWRWRDVNAPALSTNHAAVLHACVAKHALTLSPYVLLEIVNWVLHMTQQSRLRKIRLIFGAEKSAERARHLMVMRSVHPFSRCRH